jgi:hypothetical protein
MLFPLEDPDFRGRLNSLTKYPAIPTYHTLRGGKEAVEPVLTPFPAETMLEATEKVDGTNVRLIVLPDGTVLLGSRDELLTPEDRPRGVFETVGHPEHIARTLDALPEDRDYLAVFFFEVFGSHITDAYKNYTTAEDSYGAVLLDTATIHDYERMLARPREKIALWRDHGGQKFTQGLYEGFYKTAPVLGTVASHLLPSTVQGIYNWLLGMQYHGTSPEVQLSTHSYNRPEGIVLRTLDRRVIAKIRREEYERALGIRGFQPPKDPKVQKKHECPACHSSLSDQVLVVDGAPCTHKFHPVNR